MSVSVPPRTNKMLLDVDSRGQLLTSNKLNDNTLRQRRFRITSSLAVEKLAGRYFCAGPRQRNVSAISIQLYWRAAARAGSFVAHEKEEKGKNNLEMKSEKLKPCSP